MLSTAQKMPQQLKVLFLCGMWAPFPVYRSSQLNATAVPGNHAPSPPPHDLVIMSLWSYLHLTIIYF